MDRHNISTVIRPSDDREEWIFQIQNGTCIEFEWEREKDREKQIPFSTIRSMTILYRYQNPPFTRERERKNRIARCTVFDPNHHFLMICKNFSWKKSIQFEFKSKMQLAIYIVDTFAWRLFWGCSQTKRILETTILTRLIQCLFDWYWPKYECQWQISNDR